MANFTYIYISLSIISNTVYLLSVLFPFCLNIFGESNIYNVAPNLLIIKQKRPVKIFFLCLGTYSYFIFEKPAEVIIKSKL